MVNSPSTFDVLANEVLQLEHTYSGRATAILEYRVDHRASEYQRPGQGSRHYHQTFQRRKWQLSQPILFSYTTTTKCRLHQGYNLPQRTLKAAVQLGKILGCEQILAQQQASRREKPGPKSICEDQPVKVLIRIISPEKQSHTYSLQGHVTWYLKDNDSHKHELIPQIDCRL